MQFYKFAICNFATAEGRGDERDQPLMKRRKNLRVKLTHHEDGTTNEELVIEQTDTEEGADDGSGVDRGHDPGPGPSKGPPGPDPGTREA